MIPLFLSTYNDWYNITVSFVAFLSAGNGSFCPKLQMVRKVNTDARFRVFILCRIE
jgi:hypothetical protein